MKDAKRRDGEPELTPERREFLKQCAALAGAGVAGVVVVSEAAFGADIVAADDARLVTQRIKYPTEKGEMDAYLARPKDDEKHPAVIVIQEIFGLTPHIEDVARRMALEGFVAVAPDALTPVGGTAAYSAGGMKEMFQAMGKVEQADHVKNFTAAVQYLKTHPQSTGNVGCTGFCWGGGMTNQVAVHSPDLKAAVPYYGTVPAEADVPKIKAAMLCHYAENDAGINAGIPAFEAALKKAGVEYQIFSYPGTNHGFNNDSAPERYHKEAAEQSWKRTIDFFKEKLA
ncbi:MAG: dienelactone hydrolase family protein [Acidobacteriota bacterium]|jgi:carboxymethylenebutenolidase|nr:dienelactone hydrolase family protein [Acidobacteriota bacterium]